MQSLPNWKEDFYALGMHADTPILGLYNVLLLADGLKRLVNKDFASLMAIGTAKELCGSLRKTLRSSAFKLI
jgi:hypothetical protein